ncbi:MAG: VWA domain-containing protein [Polyangiaceae bacterium]
MILGWIEPHTRRSIALAAIVLSATGLVLADRGAPLNSGGLVIATNADSSWSASSSSTSTPFSAQGATGRFAISHGRLLSSGVRPMHAEIRIRAEDSDVVEARAPVSLVLAIDTSGSMAGRKIEDARRSAMAMLDEMRPDDMVGVVRFSSSAETLVPLARVGEIRTEARRKIEGLRAEGSTDIANALRTADRMLGWSRDRRIGRIVLVTDGRDTSGAPASTGIEVARVEASHGFTVSALGIGSDYDDVYLSNISNAGRGNYEYLRDSSALARFLSKELVETAKTRVKGLEVALDLPPSARVRDVWGATWEGNRLSVGSLFAGDERRVVVAIDVPMDEPGTVRSISGTISYRLANDNAMRIELAPLRMTAVTTPEEVDNARDMSVLASVTSVIASRRETEAAMAFEKGDRDRAMQLNAQNQAEIEKARKVAPKAMALQLDAQKRAYESHQGTFATTPPAAAAPAARDIGAQERKNADRAVAY